MENCDSSNNNHYCVCANENCIVRKNYKPRFNHQKIDAFTIPYVVKHLSPEQIKFWNEPPFTFQRIPKPETPLPWWKFSPEFTENKGKCN